MNNVDKLIRHMTKALSLIQIELIYTSNNVIYERVELYRDFTLTLDDLIESTYFGHDMLNFDDRVNHFNWCWDKACNLLDLKTIDFKNNLKLYIYFHDLYFEVFYNEESTKHIEVKNYWPTLFNCYIQKTRSEIDKFLYLYKIFEESYTKVTYFA